MFPLLVAALLAQPPVEVPPPKDAAPKSAAKADPKPVGPPEFEVQFTDGGNIRAVILDPMATVTTKFGKLEVPFAELRKVDFGFRYPAGVEAKVGEAVAKLGAPAFRDREEAEKELLGHKEYALTAVRRAAKGGDPEVVRRAEPLLKKLLGLVPEDRHQARDYDIVETNDFTVKGRLELSVLRVQTKQFGEVPLRVPEVRAFRTLAAVGTALAVDVPAAQFGRQGWQAWMDTGADAAADGPLEVTAAGTVDLNPQQQPGQFQCGPTGHPQMMVQGPPLPAVPNNMAMMRGGVMNRQFPSGILVGKIGPAGMPFLIGMEFKQPKAGASGRLFLAIAPNSWGSDSGGSYKVKVKVGE